MSKRIDGIYRPAFEWLEILIVAFLSLTIFHTFLSLFFYLEWYFINFWRRFRRMNFISWRFFLFYFLSFLEVQFDWWIMLRLPFCILGVRSRWIVIMFVDFSNSFLDSISGGKSIDFWNIRNPMKHDTEFVFELRNLWFGFMKNFFFVLGLNP